MVNGFKPMVKQTCMDFEDANEALVDLVYDKLEKHCQSYNMLNHEGRDFLSQLSHAGQKNCIIPSYSTKKGSSGGIPT